MLALMTAPRLESQRLLLREFTAADVAPYAAMIADPDVMRFMGSGWRYRAKRGVARALAPVSHAEARLELWRVRRHWDRHGWGEWAVQDRAGGSLVGRVGFKYHRDFTADSSQVEIGWLLGREFWGRGYATEAGEVALAAGFERLGLERVISICMPANRPSLGVMRRLGMTEAGRTRWKGLDMVWTAIDRSDWERAAVRRSAEAR